MESSMVKLQQRLLNNKIKIDDLGSYQDDIRAFYDYVMKYPENTSEYEIYALIMLCLDYYTYSEDGDVLISDHEYDELMKMYITKKGGSLISTADNLVHQSQWEFVKHESPGMVGTVKKIYSFEELCSYLGKYKTYGKVRKFRIAPKFDGISSAIKIDSNGRVLLGVTRNDGIEGQDITKVIRSAGNIGEITKRYMSKLKDGEYVWVKTELVTTTWDFDRLVEEKAYKNRRSATSGIINSPKNIHLAKYISVIPLAAHFSSTDKVEYEPMGSIEITVENADQLMDAVEKMLSEIRDSSYPIRTDGVVIYPLGDDILPNYNDIMDDAIAYKVNTAEALTQVDFGYVSVGRLGNAIPMLRVKPVEVNETTVTDVSLGSFDKFVNMDLHEKEQVLIYSAGDVIPQCKIPDIRHYPESAELLKIKKICPYCNEKLSRYKGIYRCENTECPRVNSGKITNFLIKLKAENVSDKTVEDLISYKLIKEIPDLFDLIVSDIEVLPGYGFDSATVIINEIDKIRTREIEMSSLLGALGIRGISEKKCKNILKVMPIKKMFGMKRKKLIYELIDADNTGMKTSETFVDFIFENEDLINTLLGIMNIVNDISWKGNVVFTGGRAPEIEKELNSLGYEISNNVNGKTVAVISWSYNYDSTKCKAAKQKGIDILHVTEIDTLYHALRKE